MSALKFYEYKNCGTCKKARKFLAQHQIEITVIPIRETPPSVSELKRMLKYLDGKRGKLFNTSGRDYREMNLKETLPDLSDAEMFELLTRNGNLVKRPFLIGKKIGTVGFNEVIWSELLDVN